MRGLLSSDRVVSDSRGVSDLVAFVLTFSIIITAVGVVSIGGLGSLEDYRDGARAESAEEGDDWLRLIDGGHQSGRRSPALPPASVER